MKAILIPLALILALAAVSAFDYRVILGEELEIGDSSIIIKNVGRGAILANVGGEDRILKDGKSILLEDYRIYVSVSYSTKEDSNITLSVCHKDAKEQCNNRDDDCDGIIDNGLKRNCGSNVGICRQGVQHCINGEWGHCIGAVWPQEEICNGLDDDCNGLIDDSIPDRPCGIDIGECKKGIESCIDGKWVCEGAVWPQKEICDGLDNDCDGMIDEANVCTKANQTENNSLLSENETDYDFSDLDLEKEDVAKEIKKSLWGRFWGFLKAIV